MPKISQKQLIESLLQLKEIKPRKEWAVLLKSQILSPYTKVAVKVARRVELEAPVKPEKPIGILDILSFAFAPRKLAYAFSVVLFLIVGVFGFAQYTVPGDLLFPVKKIAEQSQAALTGQPGLVATLNSRINDLAQVAREGKTDNIPSAISEINANAKDLAKSLKDNPTQDSQTLKQIANSAKTLAFIPGTDSNEISGVQELLQALIADLKIRTLTDDQNKALADVENLYNQGKFNDAWTEIYQQINSLK
jgi:uncharacterized protein YoxC